MKKIPGGVAQAFSNIDNIATQLGECMGPVVLVELQIRFVGEMCDSVQNKLKEIATLEWNERRKKDSTAHKKRDDYLECNLEFLIDAICQVFSTELSNDEIKKLEKFRKVRNKLAHADFTGLMKACDVEPATHSAFTQHRGKIMESVFNLIRNQELRPAGILAREISPILKRLTLGYAES